MIPSWSPEKVVEYPMIDDKKEIERKFILKELPEFIVTAPLRYERHYLYTGNGIELRIQRKGDLFELERTIESSEHGRDTHKIQISSHEFDILKKISLGSIVRESYLVEDPNYYVSVKLYHERFEGLIRAEVEFDSEEDADEFIPYDWFGEEITDSPLGRDSKLLSVSDEEFKNLLKTFSTL